MAPNLQRIWPRTQFLLIDSTYVPYSFVPTPMKSCVPECRLKLRALLSTPVTASGEWRCRRTGGANWADARLDPEIGKYSWRRWRMPWTPRNRGQYRLMARATNAVGDTQSKEQWNRSGFMWNVIQNVDVKVG